MNMPMQQQHQWMPAEAAPKIRSTGTCILLYIITLGIYSLFWLYLVHKEHPRRAGIDDSPGMAVGLMFIPLFNIYWYCRIYGRLSDRLNMLANQAGVPDAPVNKVMAYLAFIPYIGPIFQIIWWVGAHGAHNTIAQSVAMQQQQQGQMR